MQTILSNGKSRRFKDYNLLSADNLEMKLSSIGESNNYTVLYFWWSGCAPCRKFNRTVKPKLYKELNSKGIELVSISVDESTEKWRKASERDRISWINLYAGPVTGIRQDYGVRGYPTKVIVNKNLKFVDFEFSTLAELMELSE